MALILNGSINLSEIPKDKIIDGKKGKYLPLTLTINNDADQFGNNASIIVQQSKEERAGKEQKKYLGNCKLIWTDGVCPTPPPRDNQPQQQAAAPAASNDLPF
jgi:hypothetical protein